MRKVGTWLYSSTHLFALLCIVFVPFTFHLFSWQAAATDLLFGGLLNVFVSHTDVSSDSGSMYALVLLLFGTSLLSGFFLYRIKETDRKKIILLIRLLIRYYLATVLLKYGCDKLFKGQFYLPEPNTLFTPLGKLDRDLLFWSTMGTSPLYNLLTGLVEVLAAVLLLFRRTRISGALLAFSAFVQILFINIGFDISVKLFTLLLLVFTFLLLLPVIHSLFAFFFLQQTVQLKQDESLFPKNNVVSTSLKVFISSCILLEAVFPYLQAGSWNDDTAKRPYLHGAYEVKAVYCNDSLIPSYQAPVKRFFIHRRGYFIFQRQDDTMQDFKLETDSIRHCFVLTAYTHDILRMPFEYSAEDSLLKIHYHYGSAHYLLHGKAIDWKKLPALQNDFHWQADTE